MRKSAILPPPQIEAAIETVLDNLRNLDNSINGLAEQPAPLPRVTASSLHRIQGARAALQATIADAEWETA